MRVWSVALWGSLVAGLGTAGAGADVAGALAALDAESVVERPPASACLAKNR